MPKVRKAELSFLYLTHHLVLFYISITYHQNIAKGIQVTEQTRNLFQTKQWETTPKVRKPELSILSQHVVLSCSTSLPSIIKIFQRVFKLQSGHKINAESLSNITKGDNAKSKKGRVVILVCGPSSHPVLHFYQVPLKYSSYRADTKSISNKTKGVCDMSSCPVLHFHLVSSKYSKKYSSYRADKKFYTDADTDANGIHPKNTICPSTLQYRGI